MVKRIAKSKSPGTPTAKRISGREKVQTAGDANAVWNAKGWAIVFVSILMISLTWFQAANINGPSYWKWPWRQLQPMQWLVMFFFSLPAWAALWLLLTREVRAWIILLALMFGSMSLKLGCVLSQSHPVGFDYLAAVTWSPDATSYYYDAARIAETARQENHDPMFWFGQYDELVRTPPPSGMHLHTVTKPAGPLCFYFLFAWFLDYSSPVTMIACSLALMVCSLASIPAVYWCIKNIVGSQEAGLIAAGIVAIVPGFNLFPTKLDPSWVGLGAVTIGTWYLALVRQDWRYSIGLGLSLALILFVGFQQLTLGLFMALMPAIVVADRTMFQRYLIAIQYGLPAICLATGLHVVLALVTGYNTWSVFQANLYVQNQLLKLPELQARQAPWTTFWDLYDFSLGGGWVIALVYLMGLCNRNLNRQQRLLGVASAILMGVIAVFALIPAETARCWLFLSVAPLILVSAEMSQWPRGRQILLLACTLLATLVIHGKMAFILP